MIHNLLTLIINLLKTELTAYLPQSEQHFTTTPTSKSPSEPLPKIIAHSSQLTISQTIREPNFIKPYPEQNRQEITALREFEQDFFINIYDNDLGNIEKLASLILGIILTNSEDLIEQYNVTSTTHYQSQQTTTTHLINQFNVLEGNYKTLDTTQNFELKLQVKGHLKLVRTVAGVPRPIEKISLENNNRA
jgi:hypothetical protein